MRASMPTGDHNTSLRLRWPLLILLVSIGLTAAAAFDAQRAMRGQDKVVTRALSEFANFASWSYGQHLQELLAGASREALGAVNHGDNLHTGRNIPPAEELVHYLPYNERCHCHQTRRGPLPAGFFAIRLGVDSLDVAINTHPNPSEGWEVDRPLPEPLQPGAKIGYTRAERRWIVDTLTRQARFSPPPDHGFALVVGRFEGQPRILSYTLMPMAIGDTMVYAAEYRTAALSDMLSGVLDGKGLLPSTFTDGKRNREVVAVRVADRTGHELFNSAPGLVSPVASRLDLPEQFGALVLDVSVPTGQASGLVIGGLPRSRLPILLGLLLLAAAMSVVAVVQIRRETELAGLRADFVSSVSHELRTPLAQIRLYLETLRLGRASTPAQRDWSLGHIERETTRLGHLVENVLRFSRVGRVEAPPTTEVNVAEEAVRIVEEFRPLALVRRSQLTIETDITPAIQLRPDALQRLLVNLLDNAVKYGPAGQTIRVDVGTEANNVRITVSDEGEGVAERDRELIWRPFSRGAASSAAAGSGIGLTIVRDVATQHGGSAWVESGPGGGARFVVTLPCAPSRIRTQPPALAIAK
jgi:signal transduction histidine kinase